MSRYTGRLQAAQALVKLYQNKKFYNEAAACIQEQLLTRILTEEPKQRELGRLADRLAEDYVAAKLTDRLTGGSGVKDDPAALPACEKRLLEGLTRSPLSPYLKVAGVDLPGLLHRQLDAEKPFGIEDHTQLYRLTIPQQLDLRSTLLERLAPLEALEKKQPDYVKLPELQSELISRLLCGQMTRLPELRVFAQKRALDIQTRDMSLRRKDSVLSMGQCWDSRRVVTDLRDQRFNTALSPQLRSAERLNRIRNTQVTAETRFGQSGAPVSFYRYLERAYSPLPSTIPPEELEKIRSEWLTLCSQWAGTDAEKKEFVKTLGKDGLSYGLLDHSAVILQGVSRSIHEDKREVFEEKLAAAAVHMLYRRQLLEGQLKKNGITPGGESGTCILANLERYLTDDQREVEERTLRQLQSDEKAWAEYSDPKTRESVRQALLAAQRQKTMAQLDKAFLEKVDAAIAGWKPSVSSSEHKQLQKLVLRKDLRCRDFSCAERGIFAPLLPRLLQKQAFTDLLVGGSDEMYEEYVAKVQDDARDAMKLLTMPGSVYFSLLDQFLLELGDRILDGHLKGDMARSFLRDHYEKKILKYNLGSSDSKVTLESILKDTLPQNASDVEKAEQANLAIQVMLYEGVTALVNKARLKEYGARLKQNRAVLNEELAAFTATPEFAAYARKEGAARGLSNSSSTREQALHQTFIKSMELHEREFLILTEKPELYRKGVRERMRKMLKVSQEQLLTSDTLTQTQQDTTDLMNVSVLAAKREGRTMMQQERSQCAPFLELADRKISPLQAARGVSVPMSAEAQEKLAAQPKGLTDSDAVRSLVFDLVSARKETDAAPDLDKLCQGAAALLAMYNAGGGDEGATVAALRAVSRMPDPIAALQSGQFSISDETLAETRRAGALFTRLQKLNTLLPKGA